MVKSTVEGEIQSSPHFRSLTVIATHSSTIDEDYKKAVDKIRTSFMEFMRDGSGWLLDEVCLFLMLLCQLTMCHMRMMNKQFSRYHMNTLHDVYNEMLKIYIYIYMKLLHDILFIVR